MATPLSPSTPQTHLHLPPSTDPPSEPNPPTPKTWLIFGATGHIGRSLAQSALAHGDRVAAVGRTLENTLEQMRGWHERCLGLLCDVRVRETVEECLRRTTQAWGRIDIIVNATGYGVIAACEDQDESDLRSQFETNFMGTLNIVQAALPLFRAQYDAARAKLARNSSALASGGRFIIFSSTSGALGVPGLGPYCATKYATEALIESMLYEIDAFGIHATLVAPGHLRLDEEPPSTASSSSAAAEAQPIRTFKMQRYGHFLVKRASAPYDTPGAPAGHARRVVQWLTDRQPTSARKSAELVWQLGHCRFPPLRLLLGSFAVESVRDRLRSITEEIEDWKFLSFPLESSSSSLCVSHRVPSSLFWKPSPPLRSKSM
nr:putative oxidoreductase [Quercus suber]